MDRPKRCPVLILAGAAFHSARAAEGVKNIEDLLQKNGFYCFGEGCKMYDTAADTCGLVKI